MTDRVGVKESFGRMIRILVTQGCSEVWGRWRNRTLLYRRRSKRSVETGQGVQL